ncbi:MAG TPA: hypothetical protein PLM60_00495 [Methanoregulaceae archaeon]|nr:hypothetical protein [Methanoregulaceae archaeon]HPS21868.1 hypothetical protein [Methanoregulaceae archaeon]
MAQHSTSPVPLYLIPQALSEEIKKYGDAIAEVRVKRTTGHNYILRVKHERKGDRVD